MKLIFLDIDGTLLDHDVLHDVPPSAKQAVALTRSKGNKVILCTGRSKSSVNDQIIDFETDAQVYAAGAHIEEKGQIIEWKAFDSALLSALIDELENAHFGIVLEGRQHNYYNEAAVQHFITLDNQASQNGTQLPERTFLSLMDHQRDPQPINKLTFYALDNENLHALIHQFDKQCNFIRHKVDPNGYIGYECCLKNIHKGRAVQIVCDHYGVSLADSIAYGDSMNDAEMIQTAHLGIAMGNGVEQLKQMADEVCGKVSEDGLYKSFQKHGLI